MRNCNFTKFKSATLQFHIIQLLLLASIWGYERVQFEHVPLPFVYELIAWVAMTGPLLVVPGTAIWYIVDVLRKDKVFGNP